MSLADRFSVVGHNGQLSISRVEEIDRGVYKCVAKNRAGFTEKKINLNVVVKRESLNPFLYQIQTPGKRPQ
jgi:Immunoglobulin I-set domain